MNEYRLRDEIVSWVVAVLIGVIQVGFGVLGVAVAVALYLASVASP